MIDYLKNHNIDFIINGSTNKIPGNISLSFRNVSGESILHRLDLMNIFVSTGSACDGNSTKVSHVIKSIAVPKEYSEGTIRISLGKHNSEKDAIEIGKALVRILSK